MFLDCDNQPIDIKNVRAKMRIAAYDEKIGKRVIGEVAKVFTSTTHQLTKVYIGGKLAVQPTPDHPFRLSNGKYVEARHLQSGDSVLTFKNNWAIIDSTVTIDTICSVYNFHVKTYQNYYVTNLGLLVHNMASHGQVLRAEAQAKAKRILSSDELVKFNDDLAKNPDLITKFNGNEELIEGWATLFKAGENQATRFDKFEDIKKYLDANPNKSIDDVAKEIKDADGYTKWVQKRIGTKNTLQEVDEIFDDFYNLSFVKKGETIRPAWKHIDNGCNVRAHLLAEELNARGFKTKKIFAFHVGLLGEAKLKVPSKFAKDALENFDQVNSIQVWQWHVAIILTKGKYKGKIIDPALYPLIKQGLAFVFALISNNLAKVVATA